jgi:two-component system, OmpR family, phosphate regulon response regulator PhoB
MKFRVFTNEKRYLLEVRGSYMAAYKVLVVDDDKSARTLLNIMLKRTGFDPIVAEDAEEALNHLNQLTPDLIILDYMLPGMNGIELCQTIRQRPDTIDIPILMLSARGDMEVVMEAKQAGATDYLSKPLLIQEVTEKLTKLIEKRAEPSEEQ